MKFLVPLIALSVGAVLSPVGSWAETISEVKLAPQVRRHIDGQTKLERGRYFNVAANSPNFWKRCPMGEAGYLLDDLHVSLGRGIGLGASAIKTGLPITEDPGRPGFADEGSVRRHYATLPVEDPELKMRLGENMDLIIHDNDQPHPLFMGSAYAESSHYQRIAANPVAAAEFITACLKHGFNDFTRPRYYEPMNEPSWQIMQTPQFAKMHVEIAAAVRKAGLNVKVGGPCTPVGYLYNRDYTAQWAKVFKPFIDQVGDALDFFSFHIYDFYTGSNAEILTGLPLENAFDLLEAYSIKKFGNVKPFACSEHGATGANFNLANVPEKKTVAGFKGVDVPREELEWLHMNSVNGQVMSFIERPGTIIKTVPFILDRTDDWNLRYLYALYSRTNFEKKGEWTRTHLSAFYELWRNVNGERIEAHCADPDLQVSAFVSENTCFLCLKNLSSERKPVALRLAAPTVRSARDRLYWKGDALVFAKDEAVDLARDWSLEPQEMSIISLGLGANFRITSDVFEHKVYSDDQIVPIRGDIPSVHRISAKKGALYANLRIGVSRSQKAEKTPEVLFNGVRQQVPLEKASEVRSTSAEYVTTKLIAIDPKLLRAENEISIRFPDGGGAIGAVSLQLGYPN